MFSFHYKFDQYITVYLLDEEFFFDFDEITLLLRPYFKNKQSRNTAIKMQKNPKRYLTPDETLMYIDNFQFGQELENHICEYIFPVLEGYKKNAYYE
ncbi:orf133-like protein [Malacosoma neustria nucleopolyhedrovirus]|uniref:orf133-like protein n=1 Tax=Malacosoma neustria nuclear polyhedrosis virus TaxID=38012 RepID=UPI000E35B895|nr:orf133-like protein [Malacosoma neustria nucleopolyhedrovirus]AUF81553.1 orf133-like protein [Malacosoma neustria nucleopolyhedrovirus]